MYSSSTDWLVNVPGLFTLVPHIINVSSLYTGPLQFFELSTHCEHFSPNCGCLNLLDLINVIDFIHSQNSLLTNK